MLNQDLKRQMLCNLSAHVQSEVHKLHPHQVEAVNAALRFLEQPNQRHIEGGGIQPKQFDSGSIRMATGTGKTHVELETAVGLGQRAIIISPRILINSHIKNTYTSPQGLHCSPEDIGVYDSTRNAVEQQHALNARYLITTREGFSALHDKGLISSDPNSQHYRPVVVLDESDMFKGYEIGRILRGEDGLTEQQIQQTALQDRQGYIQNCMVLGLTATDYGVNHHLFGGQPSIHSLPIVPAVQRGLLARGIKTAAFQVTPDDQDVATYVRDYWQRHHGQNNVNEGGEQEEVGSLRAAERFAMDKAVINQMIRFHSQHVDDDLGAVRDLPTLVTAPTIKSAERIAERFNDVFGANYAVAVSGNTIREDSRNRQTGELTEGLDSITRRFNNQTELVDQQSGRRVRAPRIIVFPDVLGRGVDIRNATVLLSCRNYLTPTLAEQHLGRITREEDENYQALFERSKIGLAANFNLPGIRPVRFNDIIGGRVVYDDTRPRHPARTTPPSPPPPNLPETGQVREIVTEEQWRQLLAEEQAVRAQNRVPEGWHTIQQAATITGLTEQEIKKRANKIIRNKQFTPDGFEPEAGELSVPGSDLKRNIGRQIIVKDTVVQSWLEDIEQDRLRRSAGHPTVEEAATELGIDPAELRARLRKMQRGAKDENLGEAKNVPNDVKDKLDQKEKQRRQDEQQDRNHGT